MAKSLHAGSCDERNTIASTIDLFKHLQFEGIGMGLTGSLAMIPAASVSGCYIGHPDAVNFNAGKIGEDQLHDMAQRRGMDGAGRCWQGCSRNL